MDYIDYYEVLAVPKNADVKEIKKAYRRLARKHHPDLHPNDDNAKKKFQQINEAHTVLSDPEKRAKYDKYGKDWEHAEAYEEAARQQQQYRQSQGAGGFGRTGTRGQYSGEDVSEFFNTMFGGQAGFGGFEREVRYKGQDYHATLSLNLSDVYETQKQTLSVNGKSIRITIPAGVNDEQVIKIKGHGGAGVNGGPKGDLFIKFAINNNSSFHREGKDLFKNIDLDLYTAVLGGDKIISTFDGKKVKLKVSPGTQNGAKVKLSGKGFPEYKKEGSFGDLIITFDIKIPSRLSAREMELFQELAKLKGQ